MNSAQVQPASQPKLPLCIDLDGTLIKTDLLFESFLRLLKTQWWAVLMLPAWLLGGKANLKRQIATRVALTDTNLPLRDEVVALIEAAKADGRVVVLATASDRLLVEGAASRWQWFDRIEASDGSQNLAGRRKAERLVSLFGERGFDYVGDRPVDLAVWAHSRMAFVVSSTSGLAEQARKVCPSVTPVAVQAGRLKDYLKALRLHQWLKNVLVFLPALAAHRFDMPTLAASVLAFFAFGLCASAVYVLNDLLDLPSDRLHHRKRNRPFAAGRLPLSHRLALIPLCLIAALLVSLLLPPVFLLALAGYFVVTCLYSFWLKNQVVVDVFLLAALYTSRILAGAAATLIAPSFWLLALSMFAFLSLALVKRYSELLVALSKQKQTLAGRGYITDDLPVLMALGTASAFTATLVLALYINQAGLEQGYSQPEALWLAVPPFLYWIARVWMKTHRGEMHDDPVVFAATDWQSLCVAVLMALSIVAAAVL